MRTDLPSVARTVIQITIQVPMQARALGQVRGQASGGRAQKARQDDREDGHHIGAPSSGTVHRWLHRPEREGPEGRYDRRGPGRAAASDIGAGTLHRGGSWRAAARQWLCARQLERQDACWAHGRQVRRHPVQPEGRPRIAGWLGFSACRPRPICPATAPRPRGRLHSLKGWGGRSPDGRKRDAPCRPYTRPPCGTRPRLAGVPGDGAEKNIVRTSHSKKSTRLIGAPGGGGTLDWLFHDNPKTDGHAALAEYARWRPHRQDHERAHCRH